MASPPNATQPKWMVPLSWLAAAPVAAALLLLRDEPWTKGSFAGLVLASCMGFGVVYVSTKLALGIPLTATKPSPYDLPSIGWLDRRWGIVLQLAVIGCIGAILALFF